MYFQGRTPARLTGGRGNVQIVADKMFQWKSADRMLRMKLHEDRTISRKRHKKQRCYDRFLCLHGEEE